MRLALAALPLALLLAADPWSESNLMEPAALAARLADTRAPQPKIFYVGFGVLYRSKHIPGAVFAGPASKPEGLAALRQALAKVPRDQEIVIYCGCCPWNQCPNIRPAFQLVNELGFRRAKLLLTPTNFNKDWIQKGYPVETGPR